MADGTKDEPMDGRLIRVVARIDLGGEGGPSRNGLHKVPKPHNVWVAMGRDRLACSLH